MILTLCLIRTFKHTSSAVRPVQSLIKTQHKTRLIVYREYRVLVWSQSGRQRGDGYTDPDHGAHLRHTACQLSKGNRL